VWEGKQKWPLKAAEYLHSKEMFLSEKGSLEAFNGHKRGTPWHFRGAKAHGKAPGTGYILRNMRRYLEKTLALSKNLLIFAVLLKRRYHGTSLISEEEN